MEPTVAFVETLGFIVQLAFHTVWRCDPRMGFRDQDGTGLGWKKHKKLLEVFVIPIGRLVDWSSSHNRQSEWY